MIPMSILAVSQAVRGVVTDCPDDQVLVRGASADSRDVTPGDLFVAIAGERVDGHDFADGAIAAGAVAVLAARPIGVPAIVVDDPVAALGRLAAHVRDALAGLTVIGLTGSSGKTTTKDLLAHLLPSLGTTIAPKGSFNTEVGLPLTVLRADETTRYLVLEMGMRGLGHIHYLTTIARPDVSLVLNVGSAHLELLGSREAIAQAKGEIVEALRGDGLAVLNLDDHRVASMAERSAAPVVWYGTSADAHVRATDVRIGSGGCASFTLHHADESVPVHLRMPGEHMVANALGAAAVALSLGMGIGVAADLLSTAEAGSRWRMEVHETPDGITVVNDAYNANPESTAAALRALVAMAAGRPSIAVIGEMREIGATAEQEHREIGALAAALGVHRVIAVGEGARAVAAGAMAAGGTADWVATPDEAVAALEPALVRGDVVLVKASRSIGLEVVAERLLGGSR